MMGTSTKWILRGVGLILLASSFAARGAEPRISVKDAAVKESALRVGSRGMAAIEFEIKAGYHAQSHTPIDPNDVKFNLAMDKSDAIQLGEPIYPAGKVENYPALGNLNVYTGDVIVYVPFEVKAGAATGPVAINGKLTYQVCDNKACYLPENRTFSIKTEIVPADAKVTPNAPELFKDAPATTQPVAGASAGSGGPGQPIDIAGKTAGSSAAIVQFMSAFLVGIIFNVVPCVLPVLPLKVIGFYEASQHSRIKSLSFGAAFSLGLIATFAVFGVLIFGYSWIGFHERPFDWGQLFTKWWFTLGIVIILLGMAIGTFGAFTVNVPRGLYSVSPRHDTYWGNFLFGILTALLSTPCTFGLFVLSLTWAITQPPAVGVLILVTVGIGMASPYFILSALPEVARGLPRTGPWAELVKQMMGFLLLLAAVYFARPFLGRVVHGEAFWWLPYGVVLLAAIYLVARSFQMARTSTGRIIGVLIALLLIAGSSKAVLQLTNQPYSWAPFSDSALQQAKASGQIALVEFTADWCGNCQYVEAHVLHSDPIVNAVRDKRILMLKADVTRDDAPARPLLEKLNPAGSIPLTVIYSSHADHPIELTGIYSKEELLKAISLAAQGS